jgi:hypothetical protein
VLEAVPTVKYPVPLLSSVLKFDADVFVAGVMEKPTWFTEPSFHESSNGNSTELVPRRLSNHPEATLGWVPVG